MAKAIPIGARGEVEQTVELKHTLAAHNPNLPPVYSTPDMVRLMEIACFQALQPFCEDDEITVGTAINVEHRAASGIGAKIRAEGVLESFDGKFYTLRVTAQDETQEIGRGTVGRAVIERGKVSRKDEKDQWLVFSCRFSAMPVAQGKTEEFRAMHRGRLLLLPNAWDVASARVIQQAGFGAIATSSAGVAFSLGYPDGQRISRQEMLEAVRRMATAVSVPVTADVEAGYGNRPEDAARTAQEVLAAGAVGMNLEDATGDPQRPLLELALQVERVKAVRELPIVLNARTDVYLLEIGPPEKRYDEALRRLSAFRDAGADCVFVPGVRDPETIARMVKDLQCPVNILAGPGVPPVPELQKLGVARVSLGSGPMRAALGLLRRLAEELKECGNLRHAGRRHPLCGTKPHDGMI